MANFGPGGMYPDEEDFGSMYSENTGKTMFRNSVRAELFKSVVDIPDQSMLNMEGALVQSAPTENDFVYNPDEPYVLK